MKNQICPITFLTVDHEIGMYTESHDNSGQANFNLSVCLCVRVFVRLFVTLYLINQSTEGCAIWCISVYIQNRQLARKS